MAGGSASEEARLEKEAVLSLVPLFQGKAEAVVDLFGESFGSSPVVHFASDVMVAARRSVFRFSEEEWGERIHERFEWLDKRLQDDGDRDPFVLRLCERFLADGAHGSPQAVGDLVAGGKEVMDLVMTGRMKRGYLDREKNRHRHVEETRMLLLLASKPVFQEGLGEDERDRRWGRDFAGLLGKMIKEEDRVRRSPDAIDGGKSPHDGVGVHLLGAAGSWEKPEVSSSFRLGQEEAEKELAELPDMEFGEAADVKAPEAEKARKGKVPESSMER